MSYFLYIEIIINFSTAYYKKGTIINDRRKIALHYLNSSFVWHIVIAILFFVSVHSNGLLVLQAIIILRFKDLFTLSNELVEILNLREKQTAIYELLSLVILIVFMAHFIGCSFIFLANCEVTYLGI